VEKYNLKRDSSLPHLKTGHSLPIYCSLLTALLLSLFILSSPAYAAVESFVARNSDGSFHQYTYNDLLDSYALKLLGKPNGLYEDFASKKPVALLDSISGYIDYSDVIDNYARALLLRQKFSLNQFTESQAARKADMPASLKLVTVSSGRVVRAEKLIDELISSNNPTRNTGPVSNPTDPPQKPATSTPIVAPPSVTLARAQQWAESKGANRRFVDIAPLYWKYGALTGIRPEVLYAQSALETGFGRFTGLVPPEYNNWAGIKIASSSGDKPEDHEQFAAPEEGVRGHFNHMSAYVGLPPVGEPHGRYHVVSRISWAGTVKLVEELSGKWAPSATYHERIVAMIEEMK
jgi:hypothetical protein